MRLVCLIAVVVLVAVARVPPLLAGEDPPARVSKAEVERDLAIEADLTTTKTIQPGQDVRVTARLVNRSKTVTHRVVRPGDGSEIGWREPWVHWSATVETSPGVEQAVDERFLGRCGMFDADWHDEVVELAPGGSIPLSDWLVPPSMVLDMQRAGTTRIRLHYAYRGGAARKGESLEGPAPEGPGPMEGVEPFEIVSEPVVVTVVRPLDVVAMVERPLSTKARTRSSRLFTAEVVNTTDAPLELKPREWTVSIELDHRAGRLAAREQRGPWDPEQRPEKVTLQPGERRRLFGDGGLVPDFDDDLQAADTKEVRVAIVLYAGTTNTRRIASHWLDVPVRN